MLFIGRLDRLQIYQVDKVISRQLSYDLILNQIKARRGVKPRGFKIDLLSKV